MDGWNCPSCGGAHAPWVASCPVASPAAPATAPEPPSPAPSGPQTPQTPPSIPSTPGTPTGPVAPWHSPVTCSGFKAPEEFSDGTSFRSAQTAGHDRYLSKITGE